jgi:luciferase family oxidoreductase group 1
MLPLSVLDLSPVVSGVTPADSLRRSIDLARHVDRLGYARYWTAEHHAIASVASPAPEILIGQVAAVTQNIRVGAGGVMLPNHAPLLVAERYRMLEALFPGRIDLGVGRAPGTDPVTSFAVRRWQGDPNVDDFPERLAELMAWGGGGFPEGHPFRTIAVMPGGVALPPVFILGSSDYGARMAAKTGAGFAFAHHFASHDAAAAMLDYRARFAPGLCGERPHAILAVAAICAETDAEAERLASGADLSALRRMRGTYGPLPSPQEAAAETYGPAELVAIRRNRARLFVGGPARLAAQLGEMVKDTMADELMIVTAVHDPAARIRSYGLIAEAFGLAMAA